MWNWGCFLFFAGFSVFLFSPSDACAKAISGRVLKVFDGDTLLVLMQGRQEHVRLREIDAPETSHRKKIGQEPWGKISKNFARSLVQGRDVRLEIEEGEERDKYTRLLAYVFRDQTLVNERMVGSGQAFFYPGLFRGKYAPQLQVAEERAQKKGLGIWDQRNGLKEKPQDFRKRTHREESLLSKPPSLEGKQKAKPSFQENSLPEGRIVVNKISRIYHLPGSPGGSRVSPKNRLFFDTPEEVEKAGFRKAKTWEGRSS